MQIEEEYDFHSLRPGVTPNEIVQRLYKIIEDAKSNKEYCIRIIVGKGINSEYGPIIKPTVEYELKQMVIKKIIKHFEYEKLSSGIINDGAIIVDLF